MIPTLQTPVITTRDLIEYYQNEYVKVDECISKVQKEIDALKSDIAKLSSSIKDNTNSRKMSRLKNELDYYERLMNCLLKRKAQADNFFILCQRTGNF